MVIDEIRDFRNRPGRSVRYKGKVPDSRHREKWDHVLATTEERVKSEFVRLNRKIPTRSRRRTTLATRHRP